MSSTEEIEKALAKLDTASLVGVLGHFKLSTSGEKSSLLKRYQKKVLEVGIANFIKKLKASELKACYKAMNVKSGDDSRPDLEKKIVEKGIEGLLNAVEEGILKKFCETLGLESASRKEMVQQIGDEVMLTGMESFLNQLPAEILKGHCTQLDLATKGSKKELVERLMVEIFELEPLKDDEEKKSKSSKDSKKSPEKKSSDKKEKKSSEKKSSEKKSSDKKSSEKKSSEKKSSEKKSSKRAESSDEEEEEEKKSPKKRSSSSSSKKGSSSSPSSPKRTPWVAPPLETIAKGKHDTYVALYDNFNLPDLVKYCKQHQLTCSGKKKVVINRILNYLKTGSTEEPKKKKKRKASSATKKAAKKAKTTTTSSEETPSSPSKETEKNPEN